MESLFQHLWSSCGGCQHVSYPCICGRCVAITQRSRGAGKICGVRDKLEGVDISYTYICDGFVLQVHKDNVVSTATDCDLLTDVSHTVEEIEA